VLRVVHTQLREAGVTTVWGDPKEMAKATKDGKYDVVVENNGKKLEEVKPVADWAKVSPPRTCYRFTHTCMKRRHGSLSERPSR
jgi:hypothetical protein